MAASSNSSRLQAVTRGAGRPGGRDSKQHELQAAASAICTHGGQRLLDKGRLRTVPVIILGIHPVPAVSNLSLSGVVVIASAAPSVAGPWLND